MVTSFRRREQLKPYVVWGVLVKVIQSNAEIGSSDRLEVHFDHVRISVGNSRKTEKKKAGTLDDMSAIKRALSL